MTEIQATPAADSSTTAPGFGLTTATALIVGSIIGVGIFNLPTSLSGYGPITLVSMGLTTIGALALAVLFAGLSRRLPADGGPYAYARAGYGNTVGFVNAWSYWITAWAGNAAIAVGWVLYVEVFINKGHNRLGSVLLVLVGLWLPALVNLSGVKNIGAVQVITTVVKYLAVGFMATVGLFFIKSGNYTPWNVSTESAVNAVGGGMAIALFSYLGVETAAVAAAKVRDPDRNVPKATILGTLATAVVYMLSLTAVFGIVPTSELAGSNAPFSDAANVDLRWHLGRQHDGGRGDHLWSGGVDRLDDDLRRDAVGGSQRRPVPRTVQTDVFKGRAALRDHRLDRPGVDRDGHQLPGLRRRDGVHHVGADDRHHRGDPVRLLGAGPAQVATGRPP